MFYSSVGMGYPPNNFNNATALAAESAAREATTSVELLRHDVDRLLLITEALWTLMKKEHGYADDVLVKMVQEIEVKRGALNGVAPKDPPRACPACGRMNTASRSFCIYCSKPMMGNLFARG